MGRRCSVRFFDFGEGVSGMDCSSRSSWTGSGAFWESLWGVVVFFVGLGLPAAAVLGLLAALEPEALRALAGVPALEPSLGGALLTAGEDIVVLVWMFVEISWFVVDINNQIELGSCKLNVIQSSPLGVRYAS